MAVSLEYMPFYKMIIFGFLLLLMACQPPEERKIASNDSTTQGESDEHVKDVPVERVKPALPISLGQALRCEKIAKFALNNPKALQTLSEDDARSIQLRARSAAYAKGEEQKLTPSEIKDQYYKIYLGYEGAGIRVSAFGPPPTPEERKRSQIMIDAAIDEALPKLSAELIEICKPMFLN